LDIHIQKIIDLPLVDIQAIEKAGFVVAVDAVNSVGGIAIPKLLKALRVKETIELYCDATGDFPHNPEPLPEHLTQISKVVQEKKAHLGFVVDPDVDRLAIVNEDGTMFGEEYTLVAVADYILNHKKGNTVSNLSSSRALRDVTEKYGGRYYASAVGEVNVVKSMKETHAVIGGEGNGGVIYPDLHYGRDALVGMALFLTHLAKNGETCSSLRKKYPQYSIVKNKMQLTPGLDVDKVLLVLKNKFAHCDVITIDGVKIEYEYGWVHLRKSNTEPILRIYAESKDVESANKLANEIKNEIQKII
jgi:phosphomannomutase